MDATKFSAPHNISKLRKMDVIRKYEITLFIPTVRCKSMIFRLLQVQFKKSNGDSFYNGGLKLEILSFVFKKQWYVSYYQRPAGDESEHDEVILGFHWWTCVPWTKEVL